MARIGFLGLGNMGMPMAQNLLKAGHGVAGFDVVAASLGKLNAAGGSAAASVAQACAGAEVVITMLPAIQQVRDVYLDPQGVIASAAPGALLIDSSTIDVDTARAVSAAAEAHRLSTNRASAYCATARPPQCRTDGHILRGRPLQ